MTPNGIKSLYRFYQQKIDKLNNWQKNNENKYLTLIHTDESKNIVKKHEKIWSKIKDLIRSTNNKSDGCGEKFMKIKFNSDDNLPLRKILEFHSTVKVVKSV